MLAASITELKAFFARGLLWLFRWQLVGEVSKTSPKQVMIAAPHTTNWDLLWMLACAWAMRVNIHWVGKQEIFMIPILGLYFRWIGGIAIDRSQRTDTVQVLADQIRARDKIILLIPPEGTRKRSSVGWRTGFYYIAHQADVPIAFAFLDYRNKRLGVGGQLQPSGNIEKDFKVIKSFYENIHGKYPDQQCPLHLKQND